MYERFFGIIPLFLIEEKEHGFLFPLKCHFWDLVVQKIIEIFDRKV
jgi:hypothetical protein